jgi:hypothetical protein
MAITSSPAQIQNLRNVRMLRVETSLTAVSVDICALDSEGALRPGDFILSMCVFRKSAFNHHHPSSLRDSRGVRQQVGIDGPFEEGQTS